MFFFLFNAQLKINQQYSIIDMCSSMKESQNNGKKLVSPQEFLSLMKKNEKNRQWILKQLEQLQIDTKLLENYPLHELYSKCEEIFKSTYSVKYLGMNKNEMGVISRRLDPFKDTNFSLNGLPQFSYIINKYFYPKPLKVGNRQKKESIINCRNLESEIISAFASQNPQNRTKKKQNQSNPFSKNKTGFLTGSWQNMDLNSNKKNKSQTFTTNFKSSGRKSKSGEVKDVTKNLMIRDSKTTPFANSYSRFLNQGLLVIRDKH